MKGQSRGMYMLEGIFLEYEREIARLERDNERLRKDLDDWIGLAMKGQAVHENAMMQMIVGVVGASGKEEP